MATAQFKVTITMMHMGVPIYHSGNGYTTPISVIGAKYMSHGEARRVISQRLNKVVTAHRKPTPAEIRFGLGSTHYREFTMQDFWCFKQHRLKSKIKAGDDGLWYFRT